MSDKPEKVKILSHGAVLAKLDRMAWEIYEANYNETALALVGVDVRGGWLAEELLKRIRNISPLQAEFWRAPRSGDKVVLQHGAALAGKNIVIIDDVLYTGDTLFMVLTAVKALRPNRVQVAVLIDRGHRKLPIRPDFVGMELATTLRQHVSVEMTEDGKLQAYIL